MSSKKKIRKTVKNEPVKFASVLTTLVLGLFVTIDDTLLCFSVEREASKNIEENERECFKDAIVSSRSLNKGFVEPTNLRNAIREVSIIYSKKREDNYFVLFSSDNTFSMKEKLYKSYVERTEEILLKYPKI